MQKQVIRSSWNKMILDLKNVFKELKGGQNE